MREEVVHLLNDLNRKFYADLAAAFAASRGETEPGLERILAQVNPGAWVLDLGCGQGRVAAMLPADCHYVGMDFSTEMLAQFEPKGTSATVRFVVGDLLDSEWPILVAGVYDWIIMRAVLQHIAGIAQRREVLKRAAGLLAPSGRLLLANWQFLDVERLQRRLLPWTVIGLTEADVEPGDYLLDWQREGYGIRYVHLVDEAETLHLAAHAGLQVETLFRADGHHNNLTLYAVLRATEGFIAESIATVS
ncbi:MAG TPA: class I SAM-dependent methyltransferase [Anaerolineae bacterium]|nr:class I SAM-dependent methyltransferase [Anaerolineae bacterium]HQK14637.1 class I SAM-dependent methyltransferase [Anaerolineae bacterium]